MRKKLIVKKTKLKTKLIEDLEEILNLTNSKY